MSAGPWVPKPENEQQKAERKRLRSLVHDYCFNEQSGRGCATCPVDKAGACGGAETTLRSLRKAEQIILKEREAQLNE